MSEQTVEENVEQIAALFDDGFQWKDIWEAIPKTMELVETFGGLDGAAKKERALAIIDKLLDKVNLPGWDWLTKKAIMWFAPGAVDKLVAASKGAFNF